MKNSDMPKKEPFDELLKDLRYCIKNPEELENKLILLEKAMLECKESHRLLLETIPHGIQECDTSGTITFSNTIFCRMIGYGMDEFVGKKIWDTLDTEEDKQRLKTLFLSIVEEQPTLTPYISKLHTKDGRPITLQIDWNYKRNQQGDVTGFVSVITDITERKHMEEELLKARKLESIGILAGGIAHDFNNLLTAILGNISLSKMRLHSDDKVLSRLTEAEKACENAKELSNRLLTFSKGGEPFRRMSSISEVMKETVRHCLLGSPVVHEFNIPGNLSSVEIDKEQMKQVFSNIVTNAKEAMPEGGTLKVYAKNINVTGKDQLPLKDGNYVKISIRDTGSGIPEENISRIFDPYFTTKEMGSNKGMGLGLAVCYSIIKKHEGHVAVESQPDSWTAFHLYLPAA
jgi:PAS domain S-box-containing protein